jgi:hypothetical protein
MRIGWYFTVTDAHRNTSDYGPCMTSGRALVYKAIVSWGSVSVSDIWYQHADGRRSEDGMEDEG